MKRFNGIEEKSSVADGILNVLFILYSIACIYPLLLVFGVSLSDENSIFTYGYSVIPHVFSLTAYEFIRKTGDVVGRAYVVTTFVTIVGTIAATLVTALFAYPLSRKEFSHRKFFTFALTITILFNGGLVPWYVVNINVLHINNTIFALILPSLLNAWNIIILRTFLKINIPDTVVEAARIDGSGELRTFFQIVMPMSLPGLATIALFNTLGYWNDWWLPFMLIDDPRYFNLQYLIYRILNSLDYLAKIQSQVPGVSSQYDNMPNETARMAMCIISIGPIILAYPFFQKFFIKGLTIGSLKG